MRATKAERNATCETAVSWCAPEKCDISYILCCFVLSTHQALTANFALMLGWHFELPRSAHMTASSLRGAFRATSFNFFQHLSGELCVTLINHTARAERPHHRVGMRVLAAVSGVCGFQKYSPALQFQERAPRRRQCARALTICVH